MSENAWIEHDGGPMPVDGDVLVNIKTADNDPSFVNEDVPAELYQASDTTACDWWTGSNGCWNWRIIAYRLSGPTS